MKHFMRLNPEPFNQIRYGTKKIELRLLDQKRSLIKTNDEIEFSNLENENEKLIVRVLKIHKFKSFEELYKVLPLEKCGYQKNEIPNASPSDMEKYYSVEEQSKYGVIGIEFSLNKP